MTGERGVALILAILVTSFLSAVGLGLAMVVFMDQLATGNLRGSVGMLYAADAGIEWAARDLAHEDDWNAVLAGTVHGSLTDGAPGGVREIPGGGRVDLTAATNLLNCGRATACTPAQMAASTRERPWGPNNPRWRLFAYGPFGAAGSFERPVLCYMAVWVADDSREEDDDPLADAAGGAPGQGILRVRAEAYGPRNARRAIEAELARFCVPESDPDACEARIRVQSWQELRQVLP